MEDELARAVDALAGLVWTAFPGGLIEFANQRWRQYTGWGLGDVGESTWQAVVHPDDLPGVAERLQSMPDAPEAIEVEARLRSHSGDYRWFLISAAPLTDASGRLVKWCGMTTDIEERKRTEEASREREVRLQLVLDNLPALVVLLDPNGELQFANRRVLDYFGKSFDELKAWATTDAVHPDDLPRIMPAWIHAIQTGEPYDVEHRMRRWDGVYRWFHVRMLPLRDADGRIMLWQSVQTDIDDQKRAETELAGEKQLLEMIASGRALPDVLAALCTCFEQAAPDCLCGVYPVDWSGPTFHNVWSTPISSLDSGVLGTFCIYRRIPGTPSPHQQELIAQVTRIASIAIDRERKEAELKRSEAFLAQAQRLTLTGSLWWKTATGEITWSEETYRLMEWPVTVTPTVELILRRCHPDDLPIVQEKVAAAVHDGVTIDFEHRLLMPNGTVKHVHVVMQNVGSDSGAPELVGAIQDVTQQRHSEEALGKLRSELAHVARITSLGALTASIAHEVNQPLSGIITNASTCLRMLATEPPNVDGARETARRTIRDGNRASEVVTRLRALYARKTPTLEPVDLNEATREVIALSRSELQRSNATMRAELGEDLPLIMGDRVQLQQVIMNLLRNASDAMSGIDDRPREIVVRTSLDDGDRVCLSVRDSGVGFGTQGAEKVFDAFYTTKADGMGIGLSVSRSIIESHRGRLWAVPNDGPGATFAFAVPCGLDFGLHARRPRAVGKQDLPREAQEPRTAP